VENEEKGGDQPLRGWGLELKVFARCRPEISTNKMVGLHKEKNQTLWEGKEGAGGGTIHEPT